MYPQTGVFLVATFINGLKVTWPSSVQKDELKINLEEHEYEKEDKKFSVTERDMLVQMLFDASISASDFQAFQLNTTPRQKALLMIAAKEAKLNHHKLSIFARASAKIPKSWVDRIAALNHTKIHTYMFSGSVIHQDVRRNRKWLLPFVQRYFGSHDYYRATDAQKTRYHPVGAFDYTLLSRAGFRPKNCGAECYRFDAEYWESMTQSKFALCPGGDQPYSYRFYETMLAQSIPVIDATTTDLNFEKMKSQRWMQRIGYKHMTTKDHTWDAEVVKQNYNKFIKYQTFMTGDNTP